MFIRVFKSNFPGLIAGLFIIQLVFWIDVFIFAFKGLPTYDDKALFFNYLSIILAKNPYLNLVVSFILVFSNALFISNIISSFDLLPKKTYIPALIYISFMSSHNMLVTFNPAIISGFFLLILLQRIYKTYNNPDDLSEVFNIGLLCGFASLFYLPATFYIVFVWIALIIFQSFSIRRWIITIIGFLTPYIFVGVILFLLDKLDFNYVNHYITIFRLPNYQALKDLSTPEYLLIGYFTLIVLSSFLSGIFHLQEKIIRTRKMFTIATWFFIITLLIAFFSRNISISIAFAIIPFSLFVPNFFLQMHKKVYAELWYLTLIAIIIIHKLNLFF